MTFSEKKPLLSLFALLPSLSMGLLACSSSAGGHNYEYVRLSYTGPTTSAQAEIECIAIPVLHGSRTVREVSIDDGLEAEVQATNYEVVLIARGSAEQRRAYTVNDNGVSGIGSERGIEIDGYVIYVEHC